MKRVFSLLSYLNLKGIIMKKTVIILVSLTTLVFSWSLQEVMESEGTQTNLIKCDNGNIRAIYFNSENGKYEITPTISFDTLEEGAKYVCGE